MKIAIAQFDSRGDRAASAILYNRRINNWKIFSDSQTVEKITMKLEDYFTFSFSIYGRLAAMESPNQRKTPHPGVKRIMELKAAQKEQ